MTAIAFHFNAPAKLDYACRLLRKAVQSGSDVAVLADAATLERLDEKLWSFSALDFLPHARADALAPDLLRLTPICLCESADQGLGRSVLVNLGSKVPEGFESFARLIEVVAQDEDDRQHARMRWKHYADRGYDLIRHDLRSSENT
jgi:DNA polymerase III subunit chi